MIKKIRINLIDVFSLGCLTFLVLNFFDPFKNWFYLTQGELFQLEFLLLLAMLYICFVMIHHYFDKSLTTEAALEYTVLAVLVLVIMAGVLYK